MLEKVDSAKILKSLTSVDTAKATGCDNIPNKILKIAATYIFQSLTNLFNLSIDTKVFPCELKIAKVCPIFKSGKHNDPNNYRPISIISTVVRVFERLIYEQLYTHLTEYNHIYPRQSGFRSVHCTVTALDFTNDWCFNIDQRCHIS